MSRSMNEGNITGMKQDRYRHSRFEQDEYERSRFEGGVDHGGLNVLGNVGAENRGRRGDEPRNHRFNQDTPFENGRLTNWGNRRNWDPYFSQKSFRSGRKGGAILSADENDHTGRGPRGYRRSDDTIFEDVCEMLFRSPDVDASDMEVEVKKGCVYLRGEVRDRRTKRMAELEIENISGVQDVQNLLTFPRGDQNGTKY